MVGTIATGLFVRKEVAGYDGAIAIDGGVLLDGNIRQLGIQILEALIGFTWSFVGSYILLLLSTVCSDWRYWLRTSKCTHSMIEKVSTNILLYSDVIAGMDTFAGGIVIV